ncbi:Golgin subfamily A member 7/ERF4 family-domain-containing protein, partial [Bisporella sp. PMI_857]
SSRKRDQSIKSEVVVAIPLSHPTIRSHREEAGAGGEYPLLTLPEQRHSRHSGSLRGSLQVERSGSETGSNRISLPRSVSIDISRSKKSGEPSPLSDQPKLDKGKGKAVEYSEDIPHPSSQPGTRKRAQSIGLPTAGLSFEKGKGKAAMATDLESGPQTQNSYTPNGISHLPHSPNNASHASLHSGIGPALSTNGTSIVGSDGPAGDPAQEWGPQHPCYPHMNPHVPLSSPLYQSTRIIRIRRDWMVEGDLAPTFSNLYPEILDPAGVSEAEFRTLIERINNELVPAFNPWGVRNMVDALLGLVTGWVWDDLGWTGIKGRLAKVEKYLEEWNTEMERRSKDGLGSVPQVLDIQVPDPEVSYPNDDRPHSRLSQQVTH